MIFDANMNLIRTFGINMKHFSSKLAFSTFLYCSCMFSVPAIADTLEEVTTQSQSIIIPLSEKVMSQDIDMPWRGLSKKSVREQYGPPINMHTATGTPPISRWDYKQFTVYFESETVIHSVMTQN